MIKLGLIGYPLGHSFSKTYYLSKFEKENIQHIDYDLYSIENINQFKDLYLGDIEFKGFNVTIPYKMTIMNYLSELSDEAKIIGAVNCITISHNEQAGNPFLKGYNTDAYGFEMSLTPLLNSNHQRALVLGNGGAAKAILYVLGKLNIPYLIVSRTRENGDITYTNIEECPAIPYQVINEKHILYDLIYNPEETLFLEKGKEKGAIIKNGYEMLVLQAEKNWEIWNGNF